MNEAEHLRPVRRPGQEPEGEPCLALEMHEEKEIQEMKGSGQHTGREHDRPPEARGAEAAEHREKE